MKPIQIIIVSQHHHFRETLALIMGYEYKLKEHTFATVSELNDSLEPTVLIIEARLKSDAEVKIIQYIQKKTNCKLIPICNLKDQEQLQHWTMLDPYTIVGKESKTADLLTAIEQAIANRPFHSDPTVKKLMRLLAEPQEKQKVHEEQLTEEEVRIIQLICNEYTNEEIGEILHKSKRTIETKRRKILAKVDAKNTAGIVKYAIQNKIHNFQSH